MSAGAYIQINIFPMAALLVVRSNLKHNLSYSWRNRCLATIMELTALELLVNMLAWCLNGTAGAAANRVLWIGNTVYYILMEFMALLWFLYVYDKVNNGNGQWGIRVLVKAVPALVCLALLMAVPIKPFIFYIDENNLYNRGMLYAVSIVAASGYILAACILAFREMMDTSDKEMRLEYFWLVIFGLFPLVGGLLQNTLYGGDFLWPFTSVALVMVYLNIQQDNVSRDGMTGLNNRRRLDQYISRMHRGHMENDTICCSILDIDRFKQINDSLGHQEGDRAICLIAETLKKVYGNTRSFLARYGGDEFVIISRGFDARTEKSYRMELERQVRGLDFTDGNGNSLRISIGSAFYGEEGCDSMKKLMELADERMYAVKEEHHKNLH